MSKTDYVKRTDYDEDMRGIYQRVTSVEVKVSYGFAILGAIGGASLIGIVTLLLHLAGV